MTSGKVNAPRRARATFSPCHLSPHPSHIPAFAKARNKTIDESRERRRDEVEANARGGNGRVKVGELCA